MFQIDPAACVLAVIALIFAWRVERRNTRVVLKIMECEGSSQRSVDENNCQIFHLFRVLIRNNGIILHNPTVALKFNRDDGRGTLSLKLRQLTEIPNGANEFAKGMIAEFALKSYHLDKVGVDWLLSLKDVDTQKARLVVCSQEYVAAKIRLGGWSDRALRYWNRLAFRFNMKFWRKRGADESGQPMLYTPKILPIFMTTGCPLSNFINELRRDRNPTAQGSENTRKTKDRRI